MASIMTEPKIQFIDGNGEPLGGGLIYTYEASTALYKETWKDYGKFEANTNPVELDSAGRASIWLEGSYKIIVSDKNDVVIYTMDNVKSVSDINLDGLTATVDDLNSTTTTAITTTLNYNVTVSDRGKNILVNAVSTPLDVNLLSALTAGNKFKITIKKIDKSPNIVSIKTENAQYIDGVLDTFLLYSYNDFVELLSDGSNWHVVASQTRNNIIDYSDYTQNLDIDLMFNGRTVNSDGEIGNITINLPSVLDVGNGFQVTVKKVDDTNNPTIINPVLGQKIDGSTVIQLDSFNESVTLLSGNLGWYIINFVSLATSFTTGDVKATYKLGQTGWITMNDLTIGNSQSLAYFASEVAKNLYVLLYEQIPDIWCPVEGGRTGNALNDFNIGKAMFLPRVLGRALCSAGRYEGGAENRAVGEYLGAETHTLTVAELAAHSHTLKLQKFGDLSPSGTHNGYRGSVPSNTQEYPGLALPKGDNHAHNNMQPSMFLNFLIKL
jgi:hypothetical protein